MRSLRIVNKGTFDVYFYSEIWSRIHNSMHRRQKLAWFNLIKFILKSFFKLFLIFPRKFLSACDMSERSVLEHVPFPCGGAILVLWGAGSPPGTLKEVVDALQDRVGLTGRVQVEHIDRLILCKYLFFLLF